MRADGWAGREGKSGGVLHRFAPSLSLPFHSIPFPLPLPPPRNRRSHHHFHPTRPPLPFHSRFVKPYPSSHLGAEVALASVGGSQEGAVGIVVVAAWQGRGGELIARFLQPSSEDFYSVSPPLHSHLSDSTPSAPPITGLGCLRPTLPTPLVPFDFGEHHRSPMPSRPSSARAD